MQHIARQLIIKMAEGRTLTIEKPVVKILSFKELGFVTEALDDPTDCCMLRDVYQCMGELIHRPIGPPVDPSYGTDANGYIQNPLSWITNTEHDT